MARRPRGASVANVATQNYPTAKSAELLNTLLGFVVGIRQPLGVERGRLSRWSGSFSGVL